MAPESLTTGSPSQTVDPSPAELLREALALLEGGVVRLRDLREIPLRTLGVLTSGEEGPE